MRLERAPWRTLAAALAAAVVACSPADEEPAPATPLVRFDTATVTIETASDTFPITVELADTDERRGYGMMERDTLPARRGMLFTYDAEQGGDRPFWMYRTLLSLDIAFLDADGRIVAIRTMEPCRSPNSDLCRLYAPGVPYTAALEVGGGRLQQWGVGVGDRVAAGTPD